MGTREYTLTGVEDNNGRPVALATCKAYNSTDPANLVYVEEKETNANGSCTFSALPDDAPVDIICQWGSPATTRSFRNIFIVSGELIDQAVAKMHTRNADTHMGAVDADIDMNHHSLLNYDFSTTVESGTSFPSGVLGRLFYRTDLVKLYICLEV